MKSVNTIRTSTVMVSRWVRQWSRITLTYPLLTMLALLMVCLFGVNENAWGYDLYTYDDEWQIVNWKSQKIDKECIVDAPASTITFSTRLYWSATGGVELIIYDANGSKKETIDVTGKTSVNLKDYADYRSFRKFVFHGTWTERKWVSNIKIVMDEYLDAPSTTSLNCGTADYLANSTNNSFTIAWCNVPAMTYELTGGDADLFSVSISNNAEAGKWNTATITVTCNHSNREGGHSATLKMKDTYGNYSKTITLSATTNKGTPTIDCSQVSASGLTYGQKLSASTISGPNATYKNNSYAGTYTWTRSDASSHTALGCTNYSVTFTPTNTNLNSVTCTSVQVPMTKVAQTITWNQATKYFIDENATLSASTTGHDASVYFTSGDESIATINGNTVVMHKAGDVVITAHADATCNYNAASTVSHTLQFRNRPTLQWNMTGENDHIYASDTLAHLAYASYGNNTFNLPFEYSVSPAGVLIPTAKKDSLIANPELTQEAGCTVTATFGGNETYCAINGTHTYKIEPKITPLFKLGEEDLPESPVKRLDLKIGETANMTFVGTDESNNRFTYPTNPSYVSYEHNSAEHTGVIKAVKAGNEEIQFHQTGTTTIFEHSRKIHVYVNKHPVNLTTTLDGGTWKVDSIYDDAVYSIVTPTGDQPALSEVTVTSSDETVLKKVDGHWKAVGAGTATLTISHPNTNDYWVDQTVTATITVVKHTPEFTWHIPGTVNYNRSFAEPVSSTNTDEGCTFTYVSNNTAAINYVNGALKTFEKTASNVAITVTQAGNYKWAEHSETFHVNVEKLADHVPFTMNTSTIRDAVYSNKASKGSISCDGNGTITLNQNDLWIGTANSLYYDIHFSGIPNSVSFKYQQSMATSTSLGSTKHSFTVYQKGETGEWSELWTSNGATGDKSEHSVTINNDKLSPSTRYLRFYFDGTYTGYYKNISVTERTEITGVKTVDFGATDAGSNASVQHSTINWYNVNPLTLTIEGENASQFTVSPAEIASAKDAYAENVPLTISYIHNRAAVKDTATLVITDGVTTKRIGLRGTTNKLTPAITWKENLTPMQRGVGVKNPATSPVALTYTSTDPAVVAVIGDSIAPLKKGNATITASFDGTSDPMYNSTSSTIDVEVTDMHVQHINWPQTFTRLKYTTDPALADKNTEDFPLTATVSYYDLDNQVEVALDRTINFTSGNENVVKVLEGNILHVVGIGETTLSAHVDGVADEYLEATVTRTVKVREPSTDCDTYIVEDAHASMATGVTSFNGEETVIDLNGQEPGYVSFSAWREIIKVVIDYTGGDLYLSQYVNGQWSNDLWHNGLEVDNPKDFGPIALNRHATKIKLYKKTGSLGIHAFSDCNVTLARYLELDNTEGKTSMDVYFSTADAKPGVPKTKSFTVNYSNITDQLQVDYEGSDKFSVTPTTIGEECGDKGKATVQVTFLSNDVDHYEGTITIHNLNQSVTVNLSADVDKHNQQITWNPVTELKTTDVVSFDATTSAAAAGLSVRYEVVEGDAATVNAVTGALTIIKDGTVTIKATAAGNDSYHDAEPVSKTFTISKVTPEITTVPTAATMTLPNTNLSGCGLAGGVASVDGTFAWADNTIDAVLNNAGYTVVFTPENTNWYATTSCVVVVPVNKAAQTIVWEFDQLEMFCNAQITFDAHSSTGLAELPVSYSSSDESIAYVDGNNHLNIIKGGEVTITATQGGNAIYATAEPVSKTLTINRFAPTIVTLPNASTMKIGRSLSDASLTGGLAELDGLEVEGSFAWVDGNTTVMDVAGTFSKQIVFTPSNTNYYEPVYGYKSVTVEKYAPEIAQSLHGSDITYGQALSASNLSGSLTATDMIKIPTVEVEGTFAWLQPSAVLNAGSQSATVRFTPANMDWYEVVDFPVQLNVNKASTEGLTVTGVSEIFYGQILGEAVPVNTTVDPIHGGVVAGTMVWSSSLNLNEYMEVGSHNLSVTFTVNDPNYISATLDGTAVLTVQAGYVFNGNDGQSKTWGEDTNWQGNEAPDGNEKVVILADVDIDSPVSVDAITIMEGVTVRVKEGAVLTIGNSDSFVRSSYGNLYVENGGQVIFGEGEMKVNDFVLEAQLGDNTNANPASSGQVSGAEQLKVTGDAYFRISFDPRGAIDYGWYDFTVPFEVDALQGVYDANGNKLTYNSDYAVMDFSESKRAVNGKYWNWFSGTLQPSKLYSITFDDEKDWNTFLFKRKSVTANFGGDAYNASYSENGETKDRGWNGMGNGTLHHCQLNNLPAQTKIQVYDHANDRYVERDADEYTYAVGTAFFVQVDEEKEIDLTAVEATRGFLAPARYEGRTFDEFRLALTAEDANNVADYLWVSASEEATGDYVIGRDLIKMGTPTNAKVAQMWTTNNGLILCDIEMPLIANKANTNVSFFAPQSGLYEIAVERAPEDATLFLTKNGKVIWNLSMNPCELNLEKGTTEGYGLRIVAREQAPTDIENVDSFGGENVRKVMIDNVIYIVTPEGKMYDIIGKSVKY